MTTKVNKKFLRLTELQKSVLESIERDCSKHLSEHVTEYCGTTDIVHRGEVVGAVRYHATQTNLEPAYSGDDFLGYEPFGYQADVYLESAHVFDMSTSTCVPMKNVPAYLNGLLHLNENERLNVRP